MNKFYDDCVWTDFSLLADFMKAVFVRLGVPEADSEIIADVLIAADKKGIDSHGIGRFKPIYVDRIDLGIVSPVTRPEVVRETCTTAVIDGNNGMGQVVAEKAMRTAMAKAEEFGMGMVAVRNSSHYGIAGYYVDMCSARNLIGITGTNARPSTAPTFGVDNMLGTNPLTIGFPTDEMFPFNLDCATSVSQRGKIEAYEREGRKLPEGWVVGRDGKSMTEPGAVLEALTANAAALVPLGGLGEETAGYKGYGYATVVEVLSAALADSGFMKDLTGQDERGAKIPYRLGHFFIAVNIENFIHPEVFKKIAGTIMRQLRQSAKAEGRDRIYTAGEREWEAWNYRKERGCPVPPVLREQLSGLNARFGLKYRFPWG